MRHRARAPRCPQRLRQKSKRWTLRSVSAGNTYADTSRTGAFRGTGASRRRRGAPAITDRRSSYASGRLRGRPLRSQPSRAPRQGRRVVRVDRRHRAASRRAPARERQDHGDASWSEASEPRQTALRTPARRPRVVARMSLSASSKPSRSSPRLEPPWQPRQRSETRTQYDSTSPRRLAPELLSCSTRTVPRPHVIIVAAARPTDPTRSFRRTWRAFP